MELVRWALKASLVSQTKLTGDRRTLWHLSQDLLFLIAVLRACVIVRATRQIE